MAKKGKTMYSKLKSYRVRFGYTQSDFAVFIGCKATNYSNKENGKVDWRLGECCILKDKINEHLKSLGENLLTLEEIFTKK